MLASSQEKLIRSRGLSPALLALVAVGVLIALIGAVTLTASRLVTETVRDQFQSQELQIASSLSLQAEAYLNSLTDDLSSLSLQTPIRSTSAVDYAGGEALMAERAAEFPGVIRSVVRLDYQGKPRFGWPEDLNAKISAGESLPWSLPSRLVTQTSGGDDVPLDLELVQASHRDYPDKGTFLLIAPVYTRLMHTEYLVYELDMESLFRTVLGVVTLDERGQLWVINTMNEVLFQANATIPIASLIDKISLASVFSFREPTPAHYRVGSEDRLAVIVPIRTEGHNFAIILSRDTNAALERVQSDLRQIFIMAAATVLFVAALALLSVRYVGRERQRRQDEMQRRQTARTLLEISRALNSTLDLEDVLRSIMAELAKIVPYDSAAIMLMDRSRLVIAAHRGEDLNEHQDHGELTLDEARAAAQVIQTGRPLVIQDTAQDDRWTAVVETSPIRSWMGLPLRVREKTVGVLNINSHTVAHFNPEAIELAEAFADQASVALQNARLHDFEVKQIDQELSIARDIQTSLMPSAAPVLDQLAIAAFSAPARQVSGDFFQYLPMPNGQLGVAVGDVSGKGIPAALLMAVITTAMRDEIARNARPADLLNALNDRLLDRMKSAHVNSALMVGIFDAPTRHFELSNGGMVQPYLFDGKSWQFVPVGGYPLGLSQRLAYEFKTITLAPGALLVMLTDGVVEAQNTAGEFFGFERLETLLNALPADITPQAVIDRIMATLRDYLGGEEPQDDITILVIRSQEVVSEVKTTQPDEAQPVSLASEVLASDKGGFEDE